MSKRRPRTGPVLFRHPSSPCWWLVGTRLFFLLHYPLEHPRLVFSSFFSFLFFPPPPFKITNFFSSTFFISFPLLFFFFTRITLRRDNGLRMNRAREILVTARVIASKIDYDKVGRIFGRLLATTRPRKLTFKTQARVRGWKKGCEKGEKGEGGNERMNERTKVG